MGRTVRLHRQDHTVEMAPVRIPEPPQQPPKPAPKPQRPQSAAQPGPTGPVAAPRPQSSAPRPAAAAEPPVQRVKQPYTPWPDDPATLGDVRPPLPYMEDDPEWEDAPESAQPETQPEQPEPAKRKGLFKYKKPKPAKQKAAKPAKAGEKNEDRAVEAAKLRKGYLQLAQRVVLVGAMFWVLFGVVFMLARVQGNEMFPAVKDGDLVLVYRLQQTSAKNDVVVYQADGVTHVGRVLALAGDVVNITDDGTLLVNGTTQSGEILYPTYPASAAGLSYPYTVPEGSVFILADYRTNAADSRNFGAIPTKDIKGTVLALLRRRGL